MVPVDAARAGGSPGLVAQGRTNREIAAELRITVRTAGSHLEHINAKLGLSRRTEIVARVTSLERAE